MNTGTIMNQLPSPGSVVEVVTRHKNISYFSSDEFEEYRYVGVVINGPKWIEFNSFALDTGNADIDYHIISASNVVDIQYLEGSPGKEIQVPQKTEFFKIKDYTVTKSKSGYSCTCVGYQYHRKCKHVTQVMQQIF
jgi:hypothetical protein